MFIYVLKLPHQHMKCRSVDRGRRLRRQAAAGPFHAPVTEQATRAPITPAGDPTREGSRAPESEFQAPSLFHLHSSKSGRENLCCLVTVPARHLS